MNAALDKYVIPSGSINSVKLLHPSKAYVLILFKPLFNFKFARLVHPSNALDPIVSTDDGISTLTKLVHSRNALAPISLIVLAICTSVTPSINLNALAGIESVHAYSKSHPEPTYPIVLIPVQPLNTL